MWGNKNRRRYITVQKKKSWVESGMAQRAPL